MFHFFMERTPLNSSASPPSTPKSINTPNLNITWGENASPPVVNVYNVAPNHSLEGERFIPKGKKIWIPKPDSSSNSIKKKILLAPFYNNRNMVYISDSNGYSRGPYFLSDKNADYLAYHIWLLDNGSPLEASALIPEEHLRALCKDFEKNDRFDNDWVKCAPKDGSSLPANYSTFIKDSRERLNTQIKSDLGAKLFTIKKGFIFLSSEYDYLLTPYPQF